MANPDGTISPDEAQARLDLCNDFRERLEWLIADANCTAEEIGGTFRGPGIKAELKKIADEVIGGRFA